MSSSTISSVLGTGEHGMPAMVFGGDNCGFHSFEKRMRGVSSSTIFSVLGTGKNGMPAAVSRWVI